MISVFITKVIIFEATVIWLVLLVVLIAWKRQHPSFWSPLIAENMIKFPSKLECRRRSRRRFIKYGQIIILFPNLGQRIAIISGLTTCQKAKWLALCPFSKWSTWHGEHHITAIPYCIVSNQSVGMNAATFKNPQESYDLCNILFSDVIPHT